MAKPRFECDVCGADRETFRCNGEGCELKACLDCLKQHESQCVERNSDRTSCDSVPRFQHVEIRKFHPGGFGCTRYLTAEEIEAIYGRRM